MSRRIAVRFMLSLLLLLSQQMALSHALTHWAGTAHVQQSDEEDSRLSAAIAQDQSCDQCLSLAQLSGAMSNDGLRFIPAVGDRLAIAGPLERPRLLPVYPPFRARAPPALG